MNREAVVQPFEVADRLAKYNVWAIVSGGGPNGQADAIGVAIARGLAVHEPELEPILVKGGLTKVDIRQVERKKTGQPKARKKNAWVKR
nr:37S ribosomal protein S9, mitochondrial [Polyrhizophydium stewartii]